jgi:DNA-binding beta-propeller fold protein YncE
MRRVSLMLAAVVAMVSFSSLAQQAGPYKVLQTVKVGGKGGFDYVYADDAARKLYVPRLGPAGQINVFDLGTLKAMGVIANVSAHGAAIDAKSQQGFGSSKPVVMWDAKTLATIKTIEVQGGPDGIMADPFNERVYVFNQ